MSSPYDPPSGPSGFFHRHDFLIRRLHSLSGLVPVGAYMVIHLLTNASLLNGVGAFQNNVMMIHSLGKILPVVEWGGIFLPLIFHAVVGVWIVTTGQPNSLQYRMVSNRRYTWQRWTGMIAMVFIFVHVFQLHGWFHTEFWLKNVAEPLGMAQFRPYNAASTLAVALRGVLWPLFYLVGVLACVFHLANGVWTAGITWGVWVNPKAQQWASHVCTVFGIGLAIVGTSALWAVKRVNVDDAQRIENAMYESRVSTGELVPDHEKRWEPKKEEPRGPVKVTE